MVYARLADLVLVAHLAFVLFAALGGLLVLRWPRVAWVHLPAVAWGAFIEATGGICPLTPLENSLRRAGGGAGYEGDFLEHYVVSLLYPQGLTRDMQLGLAALLVVVNAVIYAWVWRRRRGERRRALDALGAARSLDTHGKATWTRDELHDR
jgi:Protein of Unknown function (DUF2784)